MNKKLLICFALIALSIGAYGQAYTPFFIGNDSLTWYQSDCFEGCGTGVFIARPDTAFGNPLIRDYYSYNDNSFVPYTLYGHMREDTAARKVYYRSEPLYGDTTEVLLYDFSLAIGDSINAYQLTFGESISNIGWSVLDSIGTIDTLPGLPSVYYFTHHDFSQTTPYSFTFRWLEGIGQMEAKYSDVEYVAGNDEGFLHCFFRDTAHVYKRDLGTTFNTTVGDTSCYIYAVGIKDVKLADAVHLFPNPATGKISIELGEAGNELQTIQIVNIYGAVVATQRLSGPAASISLISLPAGYYTAVIATRKGRYIKTFINEVR